MAWLNPFLLGRPGYEFSFEVAPDGFDVDEMPLSILRRNVRGQMTKGVISNIVPTVKLNTNYFTLAQRNQFASLAAISDTFLSFMIRDDLQVLSEYNLPTNTTQIMIKDNSITRLSSLLVSIGASSQITVTSVTTAPYSGINYFSAGSYYLDTTNQINLATPLPSSTVPVYVTYTYKGWLVEMQKLGHSIQGGWKDLFSYDFQLVGA